MSAIGSYAIVRRHNFTACLDHARNIRSESSGKWPFKKTIVVGISEFEQAWRSAVVEEVPFDYSGYVLGNYLDAQQAVNQIQLADEDSEVASTLCKVFTAAFPFEKLVTLPELAAEPCSCSVKKSTAMTQKKRSKRWVRHTAFIKKD